LIARLQSTVGNQAVQRLMEPGRLQAKLTVGSPDDVYEKEADEVAEQVTAQKARGLLGKCAQPGSAGSDEDCSEYGGLGKSVRIQRSIRRDLAARVPLSKLHRWLGNRAVAQMFQSETTPGQEAPPVVDEVLATPGRPLGDSVRRSLEPGFGYDFSQVRIHDDSKAAKSARSVNALAFTVGNHIVFGDGQYTPGTGTGDRLLAHELTHTIQQTGGAPGRVQRQLLDDDTGMTEQTAGSAGAGASSTTDASSGLLGGLFPTSEVAQGGAIAGAAEAVNQAMGPLGPSPVPLTAPPGPPPAGCPVSPAVPFTAASAALNGPVAASNGLGACDWGLTFPEAVRATISARCDGTNWFAVLTGLTGDFSQQTRLLPSESEATAGNTNATNFCDQATELHDLGHCPGKWYKLAAVKAHEDVHLTRFKPALVAKAPTIEATITALSVPDAPGKTAAKAATEIAALPAFATALTTAQGTWLTEILTRVAHDHDHPAGPCDTAEHGVVDPVVNSICSQAKTNSWGACGVCPP
jgi:hypothetical protein